MIGLIQSAINGNPEAVAKLALVLASGEEAALGELMAHSLIDSFGYVDEVVLKIFNQPRIGDRLHVCVHHSRHSASA